jgi:hypothetical protein
MRKNSQTLLKQSRIYVYNEQKLNSIFFGLKWIFNALTFTDITNYGYNEQMSSFTQCNCKYGNVGEN